jgi:hypothetical protein
MGLKRSFMDLLWHDQPCPAGWSTLRCSRWPIALHQSIESDSRPSTSIIISCRRLQCDVLASTVRTVPSLAEIGLEAMAYQTQLGLMS